MIFNLNTVASGGGGSDPYPVRRDGNTHLWVETTLPYDEITLYLRAISEGSGSPSRYSLAIDWGDGTAEETKTGVAVLENWTALHIYETAGRYEITLTATVGHFRLGQTHGVMGNYGWSNNGNDYASNSHNLVAVEVSQRDSIQNASVFYGLVTLRRATILSTIDTGIANNAFRYCYSLISLDLPPNITTIQGSYALQACASLEALAIPDQVTTISGNVLANLWSLRELHFKPTTPPTIASTTLTYLPKSCTIYVPTGTLTDYQAADNYPDPATYTYVEE